MKRLPLLLVPIMILVSLVSVFSTCDKQVVEKSKLTHLSFPFDMLDQRGSIIFIEPEFYNQKNLEELFQWHYKMYLTGVGAPAVTVFTNRQLLKTYLENFKIPMEVRSITRSSPPASSLPAPTLAPSPSEDLRIVPYDAEFYVAPSEPMLKKEEDRSSAGYDVWYSFVPDITQPKIWKKVVLRGATWTEGKYNIKMQAQDWFIGQITITAYDLYNTEPAGRYITFGHKTEKIGYKGSYEKTRIIFSLRLDKGAALPTLNQIKLLNESVAYVYAGWMYSVTLDSGQTWHWWDAERNIPEWKCCDPNLIQKVEVGLDGIGSMTLNLTTQQPEGLLILHTKDYGQHWTK